jgi:hypothetical protein
LAASERIRIQDNRHWAVIVNFNLHDRAKNALLNPINTFSAQTGGVMLHQRFSDFRSRRFHKAGAAAFAGIGIQGKLRDNQHPTADFQYGSVHFAVIIFKDAQMRCFAGQQLSLSRGIAVSRTYQGDEAPVNRTNNLAIHADPALPNTLQNHAHRSDSRGVARRLVLDAFHVEHGLKMVLPVMQKHHLQGLFNG